MRSFTPPSGRPAIAPAREEVKLSFLLSPIANVATKEPATEPLISPLVGEMSGRTEGGAKERGFDRCHQGHPHELG
ncbi:hypothetical protein EOA32_18640 [Mesorhizobium sp. M1A.F.Ca.ET.072.01.1.1]|nr:hypothetical protein EOA32_18640 [Mesorhizobium sp. M1A.F.Ca.ET.072.01.1.1]TIU95595.1 MAG: hypothetical protein E5W04_30445 [Mesorhizobium sp.]